MKGMVTRGRWGTYGWEMAHQRDGDDRDDAEGIDHVSCSRAVRRRCHIGCADLSKPKGVRVVPHRQSPEKHTPSAARS
jgi:hypothetical protein